MSPAGPPTVPILMYHDVAPVLHRGFERFTVRTADFAWQMRWLARTGHTAVSLDRLLAARRGEARLPRRPVVLTFDDAFVESGRHAPPILRRHGFTATFYAVAGLVGRPGAWLQGEIGFTLPLMGWDALRALRAEGHTIGAHTVTHPRLARVPAEVCREELVRGRAILEEGLQAPVLHLAYPFGSHDDAVVAMAGEAGYATACTTLEARSGGEPALALRRIPVYGTESRLDFAARVLTAMPVRDALRHWRRAARRRLLGGGRAAAA